MKVAIPASRWVLARAGPGTWAAFARWTGTLKARLMVASIAVIGASVTGATLVVLERVERRSVEAVADYERDTAERMAALLGQRVVALQRMLRAAAQTLPEAARIRPDAAARFLRDNPAMVSGYAAVWVASAQGRTIAMNNGAEVFDPGFGLAGREYFARTVERGVPQVSPPLYGRHFREPIVHLTMPVTGADGQVVAVLGGTLKLGSRNLLDDLTHSGGSAADHAVTIVADAAGTILSHSDRSRVLRNVDTEPGLGDAVQAWVDQGRPIEPSAFVSHRNGRFISMAGMPGADWMVFRVTPDADLLGGLAQARREVFGWAAGVALLGGGLILALLARLLGPLTALRERASGLHDASRPLDEGWPDAHCEIGDLSRVLQQVLRERMQIEQDRQQLVQRMQSVLAAAPIGIGFVRGHRFELTSHEFCGLLGWRADELDGRPIGTLFASDDDCARAEREVVATFATGRPFFAELPVKRRDGSLFWGRLQGRIVDPDDISAGSIWLLEDVTQHREARERLSWSATHDPLTRLLNRSAFEEKLQLWLAQPPARAGESGPAATLLFVDLDHFKEVNDAAGHAAGDAVLRDVACALHDVVRPGDVAARIGGDEFALLLPGCAGADALALAERLRMAVALIGVVHDGDSLCVGASIGLAEIDLAARAEAAAWLGAADAACYQAKRAGRGAVRVARAFTPAVAGAVAADLVPA